jgi:hypothetical protein
MAEQSSPSGISNHKPNIPRKTNIPPLKIHDLSKIVEKKVQEVDVSDRQSKFEWENGKIYA